MLMWLILNYLDLTRKISDLILHLSHMMTWLRLEAFSFLFALLLLPFSDMSLGLFKPQPNGFLNRQRPISNFWTHWAGQHRVNVVFFFCQMGSMCWMIHSWRKLLRCTWVCSSHMIWVSSSFVLNLMPSMWSLPWIAPAALILLMQGWFVSDYELISVIFQDFRCSHIKRGCKPPCPMFS